MRRRGIVLESKTSCCAAVVADILGEERVGAGEAVLVADPVGRGETALRSAIRMEARRRL